MHEASFGGHPSSSSSAPAPAGSTDDDEESIPAVPSEHTSLAQAPSSRLRQLRSDPAPKFSSQYLGRSRSRRSGDAASLDQVMKQHLERGLQPLTEVSLLGILTSWQRRLRPEPSGSSTSLEEPPIFGFDCAGDAVESAAAGETCGICMCEPEDGTLWSLCRTSTCKSQFCRECVGQYASTKVEDALHFVPSMKCPGCWCRVSSSSWSRFADQSVIDRHHANASALLSVRCASCDETSSLLIKEPADGDWAAREAAVMEKVSEKAPEKKKELRLAWQGFSCGVLHADQLLQKMEEVGEQLGFAGDDENLVDGQLSSPMRHFLMELVGTVSDVERRVTLHLAILRKYPKIRTKCCGQRMCFKCKVTGWHPKVTCEHRQRRFLNVDGAGIQPCPQCGIPTQKTEGCREVRCVCGASWYWAEKAGLVPGGAPAISVALGLPAYGPELMMTLLENRADITAASQDGWGVFHYAAAQKQRMLTRHVGDGTPLPLPPPKQDGTRVEAVIKVGSQALALTDVTDNDGDTGLSVALAHDNFEAARLLLRHGAAVTREVLTSLSDFARPRLAAEACGLLREASSTLAHGPGMLWFWVLAGCVDRVRDTPATDMKAELEDAVASLVLLRAAHDAGAEVASPEANTKAIEGLLRAQIGIFGNWSGTLCAGATSVLRREVRHAYFDQRQIDAPLVDALLRRHADPQASVDVSRLLQGGHATVPVIALVASLSPEQQFGVEVAALKLLLEASASPDLPDAGGDAPLWWAASRPNLGTVQVLLAHGAGQATQELRRLCNHLQRISDRQVLCEVVQVLQPVLSSMKEPGLPVWMRMLGPGGADAVKSGAACLTWSSSSADDALDGMAVSMAILLDQPSGVGNVRGLALLKQEAEKQGNAELWPPLVQQASTALLLKELRGAHIDVRDLDVELVRSVLQLRADVNARQQHVVDLPLAWDWGTEDFTPLVLLANASRVSATAAATAVELLVEYQADVEHTDDDGDTALTWAVIKNNMPVIKALVDAGACLGQSLVEEEASPLALQSHPGQLVPLAEELGPKMRETLEDFPSPPLWLVVQFGTFEALEKLLQGEEEEEEEEEVPVVDVFAVEALLRRRIQGGALVGDVLGEGGDEDRKVAAALRRAAVAQGPVQDGGEAEADALWQSMLQDAATGLLRREIEGAYAGFVDLDLNLVKALLAEGADPNLQVIGDDQEDDDDDDFDDEDEDDDDYEESYAGFDEDAESEGAAPSDDTYEELRTLMQEASEGDASENSSDVLDEDGDESSYSEGLRVVTSGVGGVATEVSLRSASSIPPAKQARVDPSD